MGKRKGLLEFAYLLTLWLLVFIIPSVLFISVSHVDAWDIPFDKIQNKKYDEAIQDIKSQNIRVKLDVSSSTIETLTKSYISRELRSLKDVEIVEDNADYELGIIAMETELKSGYISGVTLSILITTKSKDTTLDSIKKFCPDYPFLPFLEAFDGVFGTPYKITIHDHWLHASPSLDELCKAVVAKFDSEYLDKERKRKQKVIDNIRNGEFLKLYK